MKTSLACFALTALLCASPLLAQPAAPQLTFPAASPPAVIKQQVGITDIEIAYSRPSARGRQVFGGLVPYDEVWRTGANQATRISFSTPVKLNGTEVPAGQYELFTIPGRNEWTVIIHQAKSQWGAYSYDQKNDVARVKAKPTSLRDPLETFTIRFGALRDNSATLLLGWEKTQVPVQLEVDVVAQLVPKIKEVMASGASPKPYAQAAMFYTDYEVDLEQAAQWMDAAIAAQPDAFYLVYRKALIQSKLGRKEEARATAEKSLAAARKAGGPIGEEYIRLNEALLQKL